MTKEEFSLIYHEMKLELELFRRTGKSFQDFFEQIMQKADASFQMIKPMGTVGDWKADGYSTETSTIYQCYAPEELTGAQAAKKVKEDFDGAKNFWKGKMKCWIFVWSSEAALPPQVASALADVKIKNHDIEIGHMGRAGLWNIVKSLPPIDRVSLLGVVPDPSDVPITTAAEIQVLMNHLGVHDSGLMDTDDLELTAILDKLKKNGLSDAITKTIKPAMPVAKLVRDYVTNMPDPLFSQSIATDLGRRYTQLAASGGDPNVIFSDLIEYVLGARRLELRFFWAAAGIVTYYFELCDIFER
jgi:hypothetical protein